jgi:hypothetical protein
MFEPTPGPWSSLHEKTNVLIVTSENQIVADMPAGVFEIDEFAANVLLIVKAPDIFTALKEVAETINLICLNNKDYSELQLRRAVRTALSIATAAIESATLS